MLNANEVTLGKKRKNNPTRHPSKSDGSWTCSNRSTRLMTENDLNTVDVRDGDKRVILKRGAIIAQPRDASSAVHAAYAPAPAASPALRHRHPQHLAVDEDANLVPIKSPMVGTFYSAASPDAKPFVSVGIDRR